MKKSVLIYLFLLATVCAGAQEASKKPTKGIPTPWEMFRQPVTTLYTYGRAVKCIDDNFINLRTNIAILDSAAIDTILYEPKGIVKSKRQVRRLAYATLRDCPITGYSSGPHPFMTNTGAPAQVIEVTKAFTRNAAKSMSEIYVHSGDLIYKVTYVAYGKMCVGYVFIDQESHKVINNAGLALLGFRMPIDMLEKAYKAAGIPTP